MKIVCGSLWKVVKTKGQILFIEEKVAVNVLPTNELFHPGDERKRKERRRDRDSHTASIFSITAICLRLLIPREREKNLCKYVAKRTKWFFDHVKVIFRVARVIYADGNT